MKNDNRNDKLHEKLDEQRDEINRLLEIDPEVLRDVHGGAACDCCKWEPPLG
jgi:hypothetical protein